MSDELFNNFVVVTEAVLSALSRVLREDWRKSLDLSTNIIYIFFCFSTYTHFHPLILQYKVCNNLFFQTSFFDLTKKLYFRLVRYAWT